MSEIDLHIGPIDQARLDALRALCRCCHVRRLDLFGSTLTTEFDPTCSAIDMLVSFDDLPPAAYADAYFELKLTLEDLFRREIDLVTAATLQNPYFRHEVEAHRQVLFEDA